MRATIFVLMLCSLSLPVMASETKLEQIELETGISAVQRGAETLMNACHGCHGLKYLKYRDLANFGMDRKKIDEWRGDQPLDTSLISLMPDDAALQAFGTIPPDLSLITMAREGGASYVYSYLIGYYLTPDGVTGNHIFPETKMPDALGISSITISAQRMEVIAKARDVVSFLAWAADPHEEERHTLGYYVIGYLLALTVLMYFLKDQIWSRLK